MSKDPIAAAVRVLITDRGFLQKAVAKKAGYSTQQFSDMLNGRKTIKATDVIPISKALGVSIQEIYDTGAAFLPEEKTQ